MCRDLLLSRNCFRRWYTSLFDELLLEGCCLHITCTTNVITVIDNKRIHYTNKVPIESERMSNRLWH